MDKKQYEEWTKKADKARDELRKLRKKELNKLYWDSFKEGFVGTIKDPKIVVLAMTSGFLMATALDLAMKKLK